MKKILPFFAFFDPLWHPLAFVNLGVFVIYALKIRLRFKYTKIPPVTQRNITFCIHCFHHPNLQKLPDPCDSSEQLWPTFDACERYPAATLSTDFISQLRGRKKQHKRSTKVKLTKLY